MTWMTFLWPMVTAACITMGLIHLRIGLRRKPGAAHLLFALTAFVFAAFSGVELSLLLARSPAQFLELQRWSDFVGAVGVVSLVAFVWLFFGTGRKWLALLGSGLLLGPLILNLSPEPKLVFLHITGIRTVETFGGASYSVAEGTRNPWVAVFYLGVLLIAVFVADASITLGRRGGRRRAVLVGGASTFFLLIGGVQTSLVDAGILTTPYLVSFFYLAILVAMAMELSDEVLRASQLAQDLQESEQRLSLAAEAGGIGVWMWIVKTQQIWGSERLRELFGFGPDVEMDFETLILRIHPEDRETVKREVRRAVTTGVDYVGEFRVCVADEPQKWISARGQMRPSGSSGASRMLGAAVEITARKQAEIAARGLGGRLIHAQEAERTRLARELHDDLSQSLALLAVELDLFGRHPPASGDAVAGRMREFSDQVRVLSSGVHRLSHELHPAKLEQLGLEAAVRGFCRELGGARNIEIEFEPREVPLRLQEEIALCLYRVVQEGLQNVVKHSGAQRAKVELTANEKELRLVVADAGCGFDAAKTTDGSSLGLISMHERVRLVHGHISVQSRKGDGTRIEVRVPLSGSIE